jgi:hypothetical protein
LRDFCTSRGCAISWLIVGILAFTLLSGRETAKAPQILLRTTRPTGRLARIDPRKAKLRQPLHR